MQTESCWPAGLWLAVPVYIAIFVLVVRIEYIQHGQREAVQVAAWLIALAAAVLAVYVWLVTGLD